jgi:hypothetical protein
MLTISQLLDHRVAEPFFSMCRTMMDLPDAASNIDLARCVDKAVTLSARLASRFIHSGITVSFR